MIKITNKKIVVLFVSVSLAIFVTIVPFFPVSAQIGSDHTQDLVIVKYGLNPNSSGFSQSQTTNDGSEINNLPVDDHGKELRAIADIHYLIQKIIPTGNASDINLKNSSTYTLEGKSQEIVTDTEGLAQLTLRDGYYILSEQANQAQGLIKAATPVLLRLPTLNDKGDGYLNTVYIYPKSSVDTQENTPPSSNPTSSKPIQSKSISKKTSKGILPKTGVAGSLLITLIGAMLVVFAMFWRKKYKKEESTHEA